jgi:lysozyme
MYLDAVNVGTIGYGHVIRSFEMNRFRGAKLTEEEATALLEDDLKSREETVNNAIDVTLRQNQFDMLVSLVYNIGSGAFNSSTVKRRINNQENEDRIKEVWNCRRSYCRPLVLTKAK